MAQQISGKEVREAFVKFMAGCVSKGAVGCYSRALDDLGNVLPKYYPELGLHSSVWECADDKVLERVCDFVRDETLKKEESSLYPLVRAKGSFKDRWHQCGLTNYRKFLADGK